MTSVAPHSHPELEDRITAENNVIRAEIDQLRTYIGHRLGRIETEMSTGFASVNRTLAQILARLDDEGGGSDASP